MRVPGAASPRPHRRKAQTASYPELSPSITATLQYLRGTLGVTSVGTLGFCWGALIAFSAASDPSQGVKATGCVHPSFFGKVRRPACVRACLHVCLPAGPPATSVGQGQEALSVGRVVVVSFVPEGVLGWAAWPCGVDGGSCGVCVSATQRRTTSIDVLLC